MGLPPGRRDSLAAGTASGPSRPSIRPKRAVSGDGRYSAFTSAAGDLVSGYSGSAQQVYLYDRLSGTNVLVSHADGAATTGGTCSSDYATVSGDGSTVVFWSCATNLVSGYIGSATTRPSLESRDAITLVSHGDGAPAAGVELPVLLPPGQRRRPDRRLLELRDRSRFGLHIIGRLDQIYLWDRPLGAVSVVSHVSGAPGTGGSCDSGNDMYNSASGFDLAADGQAIAFQSCATNLVPGYAAGRRRNVYHGAAEPKRQAWSQRTRPTAALGAACESTSPTIGRRMVAVWPTRVALPTSVSGYSAEAGRSLWEAATGGEYLGLPRRRRSNHCCRLCKRPHLVGFASPRSAATEIGWLTCTAAAISFQAMRRRAAGSSSTWARPPVPRTSWSLTSRAPRLRLRLRQRPALGELRRFESDLHQLRQRPRSRSSRPVPFRSTRGIALVIRPRSDQDGSVRRRNVATQMLRAGD